MGCDAPESAIMGLFKDFDLDRSKAIDYRELHTILARSDFTFEPHMPPVSEWSSGPGLEVAVKPKTELGPVLQPKLARRRRRPVVSETNENIALATGVATAARAAARAGLYGSELGGAAALEQNARQRLVKAQRELRRSASETAVKELRQRNREKVQAVRADLEIRLGKELTREMAHTKPASDEEVIALAGHFNSLMEQRYPHDPSWFRLFNIMDCNDSGHICYPEFADMVKNHLGSEISDYKLRALWKAIDDNNSGFVLEGEFGRFWRKGKYVGAHTRAVAINERLRERQQEFKDLRKQREKNIYQERASETAQAARAMERKAAEMEAALRGDVVLPLQPQPKPRHKQPSRQYELQPAIDQAQPPAFDDQQSSYAAQVQAGYAPQAAHWPGYEQLVQQQSYNAAQGQAQAGYAAAQAAYWPGYWPAYGYG